MEETRDARSLATQDDGNAYCFALVLALAVEAEARRSAAATRRMTPFTLHMMARPTPENQTWAKGMGLRTFDRISLQEGGFGAARACERTSPIPG